MYYSRVKVLLIGLGQASWLYAERNPDDKFITHTHAINSLSKFQLVAGCEQNKDIALAWSRKFALPVFSDISEVNMAVDLIVIAVNHADLLEVTIDSLKLWPNARILVEKPLVTSEPQLRSLLELHDCELDRIWINFPRNFQPETEVLKKLILEHQNREKAETLQWVGQYSGGFLNTSSHFISLINHLFGTCRFKLISDDKNAGLSFSLDGLFVRGLMRETNSPVSTGSAVISGKGLSVEYLDGGNQIFVSSAIRGDFQLLSTRSQYQLEVYRKLINIWNGSEDDVGRLSSEIHNLEQMIYLQRT